ncbi:MAG: hypothetical protein EXX96DRAFT_286696 [Benjaminiella poitrasii]|nr:MAG: hypothetical protein EXX96DRAFT_286696 [Benjaminiella poitrasii]
MIIGDDIYTDLDSLYLAEFYEFASNAGIQQDFKLVLAWWLTELGFTQESQRYCDSIVSTFQNNPEYVTRLESLKRLGEIGPITNESDSVTSLLTKQSFDTLIGSVKEKLSSTSYTAADDQTSNTAPDYSGQVSTEYNYGYGNSYTAPSDTIPHSITSPFVQQAKGIRSPFQDNKDLSTSDQHIKSPFQSNVHPVSSPFGVQSYGESVQPTNDSQGAWWDSNHAQTSMLNDQPQESYQSYEPQVNITTSYEPDTTAGTKTSWDEDDDLGFGNSSTKKDPAVSNDPVVDNKESETNEEKPEKEDAKKEKERHGWGLFSLFGRKEKETADEKKAIKANLGDQNNFYYDEKEKRWVNKLNDSKPAAATPPPPPKASTPQPTMMTPPASGLKPNSMPPPRINSAPPVGAAGEPPSAFNTPPPSNRRAGAGRKPMRSRYVDVLNTKN